MFNKNNDKTIFIILGIILAASIIINIYFIYQSCTASQFPPSNYYKLLF